MNNYRFIFLWMLPAFLSAQTQPKVVETARITEATVYLQGAQLISEGSLYLTSGQQEVVFTQLPAGIDPHTIQAAAPGEVVILSVKHFVNYLRTQDQPAEVKRMQDSLELLDEQLEYLAAERATLELEKDMILSNKQLAGEKSGSTTAELQKAADYFRTRLSDINTHWLRSKRRTDELNEVRTKVVNQLAQFNSRRNQPSNDIVVKVLCNREGPARIAVKYYTRNASWVPRYDLRFSDTRSPVKIDCRADIVQTTGKEWKDVKLTLSNGNPNAGGNVPELPPWFVYLEQRADLDVVTIANKGKGVYDKRPSVKKEAGDEVAEDEGYASGEFNNGASLADYTSVQQGATSVSYEIKLPQDLPSDGQVHQVFIQKYELPAFYEHNAVPRIDKDAFLVAGVTNWEGYDLVPGPASVYFEGSYLNETQLNPSITDDTLYFSLGRDKKVVITRELLKDFTKKKTIGANIEHTYGYEITLRNTKNENVKLVLKDQVPVSQSSDVTITVDDVTLKPAGLPNPQYEKETGMLTWKLDLKPNETVKLKLVYEVKFPKGKTVEGL